MSHASVLIAVEGEEADIQSLVAEQMAPFDENDEMFRKGSRWDWYSIGGRWPGELMGADAVQVKRLAVADGKSRFPVFYAFLRNKRWNERERMGWFGAPATTECEAAGHDVKRCLVRDRKTGAAIVSWGDDPRWDAKFYDRFVRDLPAETWLVVVDYHV